MSLARQLGLRVEKNTLLEYLPIEIREELYSYVYCSDYAITHKPRAVISRLSIKKLDDKTNLSIRHSNVDPILLKIFIQDILRGVSSRYNMRVPSLSLVYESSTDVVEIGGWRVDKGGW